MPTHGGNGEQVTLLDAAAIRSVLTTDLALEAARRGFRLEGEGSAGPVARLDIPHPGGWMRVLPAVFTGLGVFGHKTITLTQGVGVRYAITVHDLETGAMRAVLDGEEITGARTGATAALAADLLCRQEVAAAAVVGTGSVARTQVPALFAVRPTPEIRVFSRRPENRRGFIEEMSGSVDARLVDCGSLEDALDGCDLVTLATKAPEPVLEAAHLRPGLHVNSVGSARPDLSEVAPEAFGRFDRVVCDSVDLVFAESGDAIAAASGHGFDTRTAVDLGPVVVGREPGRRDDEELTLFKSTGTGLQDLALAVAVLEAAEARGLGTQVDLLSVKRFGATGRT